MDRVFKIIFVIFVIFVFYQSNKDCQKMTVSSKNIDMKKIYSIESSNNPSAVSLAGARGIGQIMRGTWEETTKEMGENWDYDKYWNDGEKNKRVAEYYMNNKIPVYIKYSKYNIPDNIEVRLACYNCGIGRVEQAYEESRRTGRDYKEFLPKETQDYIKKYSQN